MVVFQRGDQVEVCSKEDGFLGSYYEATILAPLNQETLYKVQYKNLLEEDESRPLVEMVSVNEVRPLPPRTTPAFSFSYLEMVDAFDNDGWWVGTITGKKNQKYCVYFESTREEIAYPVSKLRRHLEWRTDTEKWVSPKRSPF